jgi:glutamate racemase
MIGIFDSGVGGMTVARAIEQLCPDLPLVYFGDIARTPYGSKSPDTIIRYSRFNTDFLLAQGAELIVVACNSASSTAADALRAHYSVPILDVITPATVKAAQLSAAGRIGIIGTRATVKSNIYPQRIRAARPEAKVFSQACPLLVPLVEEGWLSRRETKMILRSYLHPLRLKKIDTLVLGCTHYPLLKHLIGPRIGNQVRLIDSSVEMALHVQAYLDDNPGLKERLRGKGEPSRFYVSDCTEAVEQMAARIFGRAVQLQTITT